MILTDKNEYIDVYIKQYFNEKCPNLIIRQVDIFSVDDNTVGFVCGIHEYIIVGYLIWDSSEDKFVECNSLGLFDISNNKADVVKIDDLQSEIEKRQS